MNPRITYIDPLDLPRECQVLEGKKQPWLRPPTLAEAKAAQEKFEQRQHRHTVKPCQGGTQVPAVTQLG